MPTIQEHLSGITWASSIEGSGDRIKKELSLRTSFGELPLISDWVGVFHFDSMAEKIKDILDNAKKSGKGGLYPFYASFPEKVVQQIGGDIQLKEGLDVPFLPFFSVLGRVSVVKDIPDSAWKSVGLVLDDKKSVEVAVLPVETVGEAERGIYAVSVWTGKQEKRGMDNFEIKFQRTTQGATFMNRLSREGVYKEAKALKIEDLYGLKGKYVFFGFQPALDYLRCDLAVEQGESFSWECAWYTEEGTLAVDAIVVLE